MAESIGAVGARLEAEENFQRLGNAVVELQAETLNSLRAGEFSESSSGNHRQIMPLLRAVAQESDLRNRSGLRTSLRALVDIFVGGGFGVEINEIDQLFRELLISESDLAFRMIEYYGQRVVGSGLRLDEVESEHEALRQYMIQVPLGPRLTGVVHSWKVLVEYSRSGKGDLTDDLVEAAEQLSGRSGDWFGCQLYWFNDATTWRQIGGLRLEDSAATPEGRRIERVYQALRRDYSILESLERGSEDCPPA